MSTEKDEIVEGYKATDANMRCRGFQFELGKWHEHDGELAMCESGFHFCEYPSGPWSFYNKEGTRIFEVEARGVIKGEGPGAGLKHVAMAIRLVKEITPGGDWNTGDRNTGHENATDGCSGFLCLKKPPFVIFDEPADESRVDFSLVRILAELLMEDNSFDCTPYLTLPNASEEKIKALHQAHIERRKAK